MSITLQECFLRSSSAVYRTTPAVVTRMLLPSILFKLTVQQYLSCRYSYKWLNYLKPSIYALVDLLQDTSAYITLHWIHPYGLQPCTLNDVLTKSSTRYHSTIVQGRQPSVSGRLLPASPLYVVLSARGACRRKTGLRYWSMVDSEGSFRGRCRDNEIILPPVPKLSCLNTYTR